MPAAYLAVRTCGKIPYLTEQMAWNAIRRLPRENDEKSDMYLNAYFCEICRMWHVGHTTTFPEESEEQKFLWAKRD